MKDLFVLGAGGHAKVVIATARAAGYDVIGVLDDDVTRRGQLLLGAPILGPLDERLGDPGSRGVLAIGSNAVRRALLARARCELVSVVHPAATVDGTVVLGAGTVVFAGAVIQPDTRIGRGGIVNTGASVDHDCVLGEAVHIAPGARLAGGVTVGDGTFIGIGAAVIPSIRIGGDAIVGAGAVVVRDVPDAVTVTGVPARVRGA